MPPDLLAPSKLVPGDRVAVLSPSFAVPAVGPATHEQAMRRLRDDLSLHPVEYPTTRRLGASAADRAADLHAAWADPSIRAVLATIGGDDQITVLRHLDPAVARADPKPFFGFSDNTNLLNWLWFQGVAAYHGGSTQMHLGRGAGLHPLSIGSLRHALFDRADVEITSAAESADDDLDWAAPSTLTMSAQPRPVQPMTWHNPLAAVTAPTWGGNLELLHWVLASSRYVRPVEDYAGCVLLLETSEEQPPSEEVFRMLRNMGERGLLEQFPAVVVARAKSTSNEAPRPLAQRQSYRDAQRDAIVRAFDAYHPAATIVFDVDFGHTDPQWVLPYGGVMTVDGPARRLVAHY